MQIGDRVVVQGRRGEFRLRRYVPQTRRWEVLDVSKGFTRMVAETLLKPHLVQERFDRQVRIMAKHAGLLKLRRLARDLGIPAEDVWRRLDRAAALHIQELSKNGTGQMARADTKGGSR